MWPWPQKSSWLTLCRLWCEYLPAISIHRPAPTHTLMRSHSCGHLPASANNVACMCFYVCVDVCIYVHVCVCVFFLLGLLGLLGLQMKNTRHRLGIHAQLLGPPMAAAGFHLRKRTASVLDIMDAHEATLPPPPSFVVSSLAMCCFHCCCW